MSEKKTEVSYKVKEKEVRFTFITQVTEVGRVQTRIQEEAFKLGVPVIFEKIGGFTEQTIGVIARSPNEEHLVMLTNWWESCGKDLVQPRDWLGLVVKEYL
jgi:hypothetical protein